MAAPRLEVQLALVAIQAVFWYVALSHLLPPYFARAINSMKSRERFLDNSAKSYKKLFTLDFNGDREQLFEFTVLFQCIATQHMVAGLLCLPSVLGCSWVSPPVASALACHGALCEVGWEIQDFLVRLKEIAFDGESGRKKNPASFMAVLIMHHTVAQCLVLPLNLYYRDNVYYHEAVLLLQAATVVAMLCQSYGFTLDVSLPAERRQMTVSVTLAFCVALWARGLRYAYIWYVLLTAFLADGNIFVLKMALVPVVMFSLFNIVVVADFYRKFAKFALARGRKADARSTKSDESCSGQMLERHVIAVQDLQPAAHSCETTGRKWSEIPAAVAHPQRCSRTPRPMLRRGLAAHAHPARASVTRAMPASTL